MGWYELAFRRVIIATYLILNEAIRFNSFSLLFDVTKARKTNNEKKQI